MKLVKYGWKKDMPKLDGYSREKHSWLDHTATLLMGGKEVAVAEPYEITDIEDLQKFCIAHNLCFSLHGKAKHYKNCLQIRFRKKESGSSDKM